MDSPIGKKQILKQGHFFILSIIIIVSFIMRISFIDRSIYYGHTEQLYGPVRDFFREGTVPLSYSSIGDSQASYGPILLYPLIVLYAFVRSYHALYLYSILLYAIASFLMYKLGEMLLGRDAGLISCTFFSFHALSLYASSDLSNGTFAAPFAVLFFYSLTKIILSKDRRYWLLCLPSIGFLIQIHISAAVAVLIIAPAILLRFKPDFRHMAYGSLILSAVMLPYLIYLQRTGFRDILLVLGFVLRNETYHGNAGSFLLRNIENIIFEYNIYYLELTAAGLVFIILFVFFTLLKGNAKGELNKYLMFAALFIVIYLFLAFFPYLNYYSFSTLFVVSIVICTALLAYLIRVSGKWVRLSIFSLLFLWVMANVLAAGSVLDWHKEEYGNPIYIEKQVAQAISRQSREYWIASPKDRTDLPEKIPPVIYYNSPHRGYLTRYFLEDMEWKPPAEDIIYLIIPIQKVASDQIKSICFEKIDRFYLIAYDDPVSTSSRFHTLRIDSWESPLFNDSAWRELELPLQVCDIFNNSCSDAGEIPEKDLYLRVYFPAGNTPYESLYLMSPEDSLSLRELFVNGREMPLQDTGNTSHKSFEIHNLSNLHPGQDNLISIHIRQKLSMHDNLIHLFILSEKGATT